jgi:hypothetical protein
MGLILALLPPLSSSAAEVSAEFEEAPRWFDGRVTLRLAPEFVSGEYGTGEETRITTVPLSLRYEFQNVGFTPYAFDRLSLSVSVPFVRVEGPGGVVTGTGGPVVLRGRGRGGSANPIGAVSDTHEEGLGDILISTAYHFLPPPGKALPWITLSGTVKAPSASESRQLGTGEADYSVFAEAYQPLGGFGVFAGAGYRFMGDPDGIDLDDRWLASAGFDVEVNSHLSVGLAYDFREATVSSLSDAHEFSPWLSIRPGSGYRIEPYGLIGASSGSADYGIGIRLSWSREIRGRSPNEDPRWWPSRTRETN